MALLTVLSASAPALAMSPVGIAGRPSLRSRSSTLDMASPRTPPPLSTSTKAFGMSSWRMLTPACFEAQVAKVDQLAFSLPSSVPTASDRSW